MKKKTKKKRTNDLDDLAHLVQLFRTNIRAVGEAKVHQTPLVQQVVLCKDVAVLVKERERTADQRLARLDRLGVLLTCFKNIL